MNEKLNYEEWCKEYMSPITDEMVDTLQQFHNIDAKKEIEEARRKEYEFYINGGVE